MIIGSQRVSMDALSELIESSNKLVHGLFRSDIYPCDKQNFPSCEEIASNSATPSIVGVDIGFANYSSILEIHLFGDNRIY